MKRRLGCRPDEIDRRDFPFRMTARIAAKLPGKFSLRDRWAFGIRDQGPLGSCVGEGAVEAYAWADFVQTGQARAWHSALMAYYVGRLDQGTVEYDSGLSIRGEIKSLRKHGVCEESSWPYQVERFRERPPGACWEEAERNQLLIGRRVQENFDALCAAVFADGYGRAVMFGHAVHEGFMDTAASGVVAMPTGQESVLGGHCQVLIGFERRKERFVGVNSWGEGWADEGFCLFTWQYLRRYARDFWAVDKVEEG